MVRRFDLYTSDYGASIETPDSEIATKEPVIPSAILTPATVAQELLAMGVTKSNLVDSLVGGYNGASTCTPLHPLSAAGTRAWGDTLFGLRSVLMPRGWHIERTGNFETVVDPTGRYAIAVAAGNNATGREDAVPKTKRPRGPRTIEVVQQNAQLSILDQGKVASVTKRQTWFLLHFHARQDGLIRAEFSLPSDMNGSHIISWSRRILLDEIPYDSVVDVIPQSGPEGPDEIEVPVRRRGSSS